MDITNGTLPKMLGGVEGFREVFQEYAANALWPARLSAKLSFTRISEAQGSWVKDIDRLEAHERKLEDGLDHFKHAGHLAFWVRRMSPVVELIDPADDIQDGGAYDLGDVGLAFRRLLLPYYNEYLAFDLGYQIVNFYEARRNDLPQGFSPKKVVLSRDYYETVCHFLKFKNVSPHAVHLIYKSLFV